MQRLLPSRHPWRRACRRSSRRHCRLPCCRLSCCRLPRCRRRCCRIHHCRSCRCHGRSYLRRLSTGLPKSRHPWICPTCPVPRHHDPRPGRFCRGPRDRHLPSRRADCRRPRPHRRVAPPGRKYRRSRTAWPPGSPLRPRGLPRFARTTVLASIAPLGRPATGNLVAVGRHGIGRRSGDRRGRLQKGRRPAALPRQASGKPADGKGVGDGAGGRRPEKFKSGLHRRPLSYFPPRLGLAPTVASLAPVRHRSRL